MPSPFEQQFTANLPSLYEGAFGVSASYEGPDGQAVSTTAADGNPLVIRVQRGETRQYEQAGAMMEEQTAEIYVRQSQIAKVLTNGRFTIEGGAEVWTIATTPKLKNGQHYCTCKRSGKVNIMPRRAKGQ